MAISAEGKLAILIGLLGLGGAGAIMVAPEHTEIGWSMIGVAALGGVMLAIHHFTGLWNPQQKTRMIALAGMIIFGVGFIGCAVVYFWPMARSIEAPAQPKVPEDTLTAQPKAPGAGVPGSLHRHYTAIDR
jgi:hypothetical protein